MTKSRSVVLPKFGHALRRLRGRQSRYLIAEQLATYGLDVHPTTLLQYERGAVKAPDPSILWALSRIYQQPSCDDLLTLLVMERTGKSVRHGIELSQPGFTPAQVRIAEWFGALRPDLPGHRRTAAARPL